MKLIKDLGQTLKGINVSKTELRDSLRAYLKDPDFGNNEETNNEE